MFSTDQRMKNYIDMLHDFRYAIENLANDPIICPVLMILGKRNSSFHNMYRPVFDILKKQNNVSIAYADGGHDVHNNKPEEVAPYINKFLLETSTYHRYGIDFVVRCLFLLQILARSLFRQNHLQFRRLCVC